MGNNFKSKIPNHKLQINSKYQFPMTAPHPIPLPSRLCRKRGKVKNVMLNLFQHLKESNTYETLKWIQGDKTVIATHSPRGRGERWGGLEFWIWFIGLIWYLARLREAPPCGTNAGAWDLVLIIHFGWSPQTLSYLGGSIMISGWSGTLPWLQTETQLSIPFLQKRGNGKAKYYEANLRPSFSSQTLFPCDASWGNGD